MEFTESKIKKFGFIIFLILFFCNCGRSNVIPEVHNHYCEDNKEIEEIKNQGVCIKSIICYGDKTSIFSYGCFCDLLCLCFFAESNNCTSIKSKKCEHKSYMFIFPKEACFVDNLLENMIEMKKKIGK
jgi:hypothetical protein